MGFMSLDESDVYAEMIATEKERQKNIINIKKALREETFSVLKERERLQDELIKENVDLSLFIMNMSSLESAMCRYFMCNGKLNFINNLNANIEKELNK